MLNLLGVLAVGIVFFGALGFLAWWVDIRGGKRWIGDHPERDNFQHYE